MKKTKIKTKKVVRIEHPKDGWGMFRKENEYDESKKLIENINGKVFIKCCRKLKTPYDDGLNMWLNKKQWFCAFKNKTELKRWLGKKGINALIKHGYEIREFEVKEFQVGSHQVVFTKESVKAKKNITPLFVS